MNPLKPLRSIKRHFGKIALGTFGSLTAMHIGSYVYSTHDSRTSEEYVGDLGYDLSSVQERPDASKDIHVVRRIAPYFTFRIALSAALSENSLGDLLAIYDGVARTYNGGGAMPALKIIHPASTESFRSKGNFRFPNGDFYKLYHSDDMKPYKAFVMLHELGHFGPESSVTSGIIKGEIGSDLYAYRHSDKLTDSEISTKFKDDRILSAYAILWDFGAFYDAYHDTALATALADKNIAVGKDDIFKTRRNITRLFDEKYTLMIISQRNTSLEDVLEVVEALQVDNTLSERFVYKNPNMDLYVRTTLDLLHGALMRLKEKGPEPKPSRHKFVLSHQPS